MKKIILVAFLSLNLFSSESESALNDASIQNENISKSLDKVEEKNQELLTLNAEKNTKIQKLGFVHKKINEQNSF